MTVDLKCQIDQFASRKFSTFEFQEHSKTYAIKNIDIKSTEKYRCSYVGIKWPV